MAKSSMLTPMSSILSKYAFKGIKSNAVIWVPKAKLTGYKNGVLKNKGQASTVTVKVV